MRRALPLILLLPAGCSPDNGETVVDPARVECTLRPEAGPPMQIATGVAEFAMGPCGEVAWRLDDGSVAVAADFAAPRALEGFVLPEFSPAGERLAYPVGRELRLEDAATGELLASTPLPHRWGFLPRASGTGPGPFLVCDGRLSLLDPEGRFDYGVTDADCDSVRPAAHAPAVAFATREGRLGWLNAATGAVTRLDGPRLLVGEEDEQQRYREDVLWLSGDGELLLHQERWQASSGDMVYLQPAPTATAFKTRDGAELGPVETELEDAWQFSGGWEWTGPWTTTSGTLFPAPDGSALLIDGTGWRRRFYETEPLASAGPTKLLVQQPEGVFLLDTRDGTNGLIARGIQADGAVVSRGHRRFALPHLTQNCIRSREVPGACAVQIWGVSDGRHTNVLASQPIHVQWLGDEGSMLVEGRLFDGDQVDPNAAPIDPPWITALVKGSGERIATIENGAIAQVLEGAGGLLVLLELDRTVANHHVQLVALDPATGAQRIVADGAEIEVAIDALGKRAAWRIRPLGETAWQLHAGAFPLVGDHSP